MKYHLSWWELFVVFIMIAACSETSNFDCITNQDCKGNKECVDGECKDYDPCVGVVCDVGEVCQAGICVERPCTDTSCTDPPGDPVCYDLPARCEEGICIYESVIGRSCDDSDDCSQNDICHEKGVCVGTPLACDDPPPPVCDGSQRLLVSESPGSCTEGSCNYSTVEIECPQGCLDGACRGDLCEGVICEDHPSAECINANVLRIFHSPGDCSSGLCSYPFDDTYCQDGCQNGKCVGDVCDGVICEDPPSDFCVDSHTLRIFNSSGLCVGGDCDYTFDDINCENGCTGDECIGCTPNCDARECGNDGCGGDCGICPADDICQNGTCVPSCSGACSIGTSECIDAMHVRRCIDVGGCGQWTDVTQCGMGTFCMQDDCIMPGCVPTCDGVPYGSNNGCGGTCHNLLSGSFIIPAEFVGQRSRYAALLDEMRTNGMWTVILHALGAVSCPQGSGCSRSRSISDAELGWMLNEAAVRGMDVYIGLNWCEETPPDHWWWNDSVRPSCIAADYDLVENIESIYGNHPAIKGYYVVQEAYVGLHDLTLIDDLYAPLIQGLHERAPGKKIIAGGYMCPFCSNPEKTPGEIQEWVHKFVSGGEGVEGCHTDIFLLQDGVGSFDTPLWGTPNVKDYLVAGGSGAAPAVMWVDTELFQWSPTKSNGFPDNWYRPANAIRINEQLVAAYDFSRRIAWIVPHHMSMICTAPDKREEAAHLYRGYRSLYFTGGYYDNPGYVLNPAPADSYPDQGGKLFDNEEGTEPLDRWIGWGQPTGEWVSITVDLGAVVPVSDVTVVVRTEMEAAIQYPTRMEVSVSTNGDSYAPLGSMDNPYADHDEYAKAYLWVGVPSSMPARYVNIRLRHGNWWLFVSEIEVYGIP